MTVPPHRRLTPLPNRRLRWVALVAAVLWLALPFALYFVCGTEGLEKWLTKNALPVGLLWNGCLLVGIAGLWKGRIRLAGLSLLLALLVGILGNPMLGRLWMGQWQSGFQARGPDDFSQRLRAIVMLGGGAYRLPNGRAEVNTEGQRLVTTAEFWHADKTDWIVTTGRRATESPGEGSLVTTDLLVGLGVPRDRIVRLSAQNTLEEIRAIGQCMRDQPEKFSHGQIGVVTSAFHMPRVMRLARRAGLELVPLPSGHRAVPRPWRPSDLVPDAETVFENSLLVQEWLAGWVGR